MFENCIALRAGFSGKKVFASGQFLYIPHKWLNFSQTTNFRLLKLKEFADDNFKFDENSRKFFDRVENTVGKGEIAR